MRNGIHSLILLLLILGQSTAQSQINSGRDLDSNSSPVEVKAGVDGSPTRVAYVPELLINEEKLPSETREQSIEKISQKLERNLSQGQIDFILTKAVMVTKQYGVERSYLVAKITQPELFSNPSVQFLNMTRLLNESGLSLSQLNDALPAFIVAKGAGITLQEAVYVNPSVDVTSEFVSFIKTKTAPRRIANTATAKIGVIRLSVLSESLLLKSNSRAYSNKIANELNMKVANEAIQKVALSQGIDIVFQHGLHGFLTNARNSRIDISLDVLKQIDLNK
ncbi:hypothetical protein [Hydrogenophaga sp. OTU3427]|uniref:hypothetical protein n=1 Tax=Hydrogenophaga sp. OTU3427 TaxID=3043856 RepID=UPI00313C7C7F